MEEKAQGALEYLLIIGGAVLVAAVVVGILATMASSQKETVHEATEKINEAQENLMQELE
ncbi:MAG: class III signal peptide [Candidatus Iainarchaeum archaeon]|uniref:Class III signal peptide n=1 Tax=Candidatus Iainarchaeum sp. TaxID=3101447 RepID=A0A497JI86_9ARCH|nr:MAG: class III signal peptide [Candidatus Diapherotrites archaeon]